MADNQSRDLLVVYLIRSVPDSNTLSVYLQVTFRDLFGHRTCLNRADSIWTSGTEGFTLDFLLEKIQHLEEVQSLSVLDNKDDKQSLTAYSKEREKTFLITFDKGDQRN